MRRIGRRDAAEYRVLEEKEDEKFRARVQAAPDMLHGVDLSTMPVHNAEIRTMRTGNIIDVWVHRDASSYVADRVAYISKSARGVSQLCREWWGAQHSLVTNESCPEIGILPQSSRPSFCEKFGHGKCLCKNDGLGRGLAAVALGRELARRAPKRSLFRQHLQGAWVVINIGTLWLNIGLQYFRPRRPTLLQMELLPDPVWGHRIVRPIYTAAGDAMPITAHKLFELLDLSSPLAVRIYKIQAFRTNLSGWKPDRLLPIAPIAKFIDTIPDELVFWKGLTAELAEDAERQRKKADAAARATARQHEGRTLPARAPRPKPPQSAQQRAMNAARAKAHPAYLLPLPAPEVAAAMGSPTDAESELRGIEWSDSDASIMATFSDISDVDVAISYLQAKAREKARDPSMPQGFSDSASSECDLFGPDDHDGAPMALGLPDPNPTKSSGESSGEEDLAIPTSPISDEAIEKDSLAAADNDAEIDGDVDAAPVGAVRLPREPHDMDKSADQPPGCICRRYTPTGKVPYWFGALADGYVDANGCRTRTRRYRAGLRTEGRALELVELWLHQVMHPIDSDDSTSRSSDSSGTSSSS